MLIGQILYQMACRMEDWSEKENATEMLDEEFDCIEGFRGDPLLKNGSTIEFMGQKASVIRKDHISLKGEKEALGERDPNRA